MRLSDLVLVHIAKVQEAFMTAISSPPSSPAVAVVAGGSGGLGSAICIRLAEAGYDVALTFNANAAKAAAVAERVRDLGRKAIVGQVDLVDSTAIKAFVDKVAETMGTPTTVVYAAGPFIHMKHISRIEPALFGDTMQADAGGFFNLIHAAVPHLRETRGSVVALATCAIRRYAKRDILSIAPKAAVFALIQGLAAEEGRYGVRANAVGVGLIADAGLLLSMEKAGEVDPSYAEQTYKMTSLKRLGLATEIADAVGFLASDQASYVTGQLLTVDGGFSI